MNIGCDIDGVLADFNHDLIEVVVRITGRNLFPPNYVPPCWDYPQKVGYTADEMSAVWRSITQNQHFWEHLPSYPWTADVLRALRHAQRAGHNIYFVTSRPGSSSKAQTEYWLKRRGMECPTVLISGEKGLAAQVLHLDWYADDKDLNCHDTATHCPTVMVAQPWNAEAWLTGNMKRIAPEGLAALIEAL